MRKCYFRSEGSKVIFWMGDTIEESTRWLGNKIYILQTWKLTRCHPSSDTNIYVYVGVYIYSMRIGIYSQNVILRKTHQTKPQYRVQPNTVKVTFHPLVDVKFHLILIWYLPLLADTLLVIVSRYCVSCYFRHILCTLLLKAHTVYLVLVGKYCVPCFCKRILSTLLL
jgi:hypothetical protein